MSLQENPKPVIEGRARVLKNCAVPVRDGTRLAADVYLPEHGEGPWPVIFERTPYNKERQVHVRSAHSFVRFGYVVVYQDVRGRFASEGEWYLAETEAEDGYDSMAWIRKQPWCNGRIGTTGLSYNNSNQSALATLRPEGLVAQFRCQGQSSYYRSGFRMEGGAMDGRLIPYMVHMATSSKEALADPVLLKSLDDMVGKLTPILTRGTFELGQTPLAGVPSYERSLYGVLTHGEYDEFWHNRGLSPEQFYDEVADVPMMMVGSWYDMHTNGTLRDYVSLRRRLKSPIRLVMGPWVHSEDNLGKPYSGDADYGAVACLDYNEERRIWFDAVLKNEGGGQLEEPPVRVFIMGGGSGKKRRDAPYATKRLDHGGSWRWEQEWPLARTEWTPYYLHAGGLLAPEKPAPGGAATTYRFDPSNPVPTVGGSTSTMGGLVSPGGQDQRDSKTGVPLNHRADVISFLTPPLEEEVEVTGPLKARLFVQSDAPDTDFTAKLIDQYPPSADYPEGYALNVGDGVIRMRYHKSFTEPELLKAGRLYEVEVDLTATANLFVKGHRIRLDISSSNFPKYDINPNTGERLGRQRRRRQADNTIYHCGEYPSHIVLPIIPGA